MSYRPFPCVWIKYVWSALVVSYDQKLVVFFLCKYFGLIPLIFKLYLSFQIQTNSPHFKQRAENVSWHHCECTSYKGKLNNRACHTGGKERVRHKGGEGLEWMKEKSNPCYTVQTCFTCTIEKIRKFYGNQNIICFVKNM